MSRCKVRRIRVADFIADFIVEKGVKDFFLLPGGGAMHLVDALGNHKELNYVACHHEQTCSIAAESYARVTENFGVALVTTGPGATNAITGVVGAWIESVPIMIFSGQVKRADMIGRRKIRQGGVQEVDIVSMVKNYTKYAVTVKEPEKIKYFLEKAYFLMKSGRMGPVWLDIPLDVQASLVYPDGLEGFTPEGVEYSDLNELEKIKNLINNSKRPLILAGHGIRLAGASKIFKQVIQTLRIPVVTTWNAMDLIEYDNEFYVGNIGVVALRAGNFSIQNCDLLIVIGSRLDNVLTAYNQKKFARNAKKIVIDIDKNELDNHQMKIDVKIAIDAKYFLDMLNKVSDKICGYRKDWVRKCNQLKVKYSVEKEFEFDPDEISHFEFAYIFSQALKGGELIVTGSSGLGIEAFYTVFQVKKDQRVFLTSGLGAMGYGLPAVIGACIANNRRPTFLIESDGSLQLNIQELATIKGLNLPICIFILDNGGYASIRNTQKNYFEGRYVATDKHSNLYLPDLEKVCHGYGYCVRVIRTSDELKNNIQDIILSSMPQIIIVKTSKEEALRPKCSAILQNDGSMISMPLEDMSPLLPLEELKANLIGDVDINSYKARNIRFPESPAKSKFFSAGTGEQR